MITGGHNIGRVGQIVHVEKHPGSFHIVHVKDSLGHNFATRYLVASTFTSCCPLQLRGSILPLFI